MADPTIFNFSLLDDEGLRNNTDFPVAYDGATETVDSVVGAWLAYGGLLNAITDGMIVGGNITIPLIRDASWKAAPVHPGNNANQVMNLNFQNDFNQYVTSILIPTYKESQINADGSVNLAATGLAAFIAAIIAGSGAIFPNSTSLHDLNALRDAFLTVRKVRNQKARTISRP
jgi:hypothetical protein